MIISIFLLLFMLINILLSFLFDLYFSYWIFYRHRVIVENLLLNNTKINVNTVLENTQQEWQKYFKHHWKQSPVILSEEKIDGTQRENTVSFLSEKLVVLEFWQHFIQILIDYEFLVSFLYLNIVMIRLNGHFLRQLNIHVHNEVNYATIIYFCQEIYFLNCRLNLFIIILLMTLMFQLWLHLVWLLEINVHAQVVNYLNHVCSLVSLDINGCGYARCKLKLWLVKCDTRRWILMYAMHVLVEWTILLKILN